VARGGLEQVTAQQAIYQLLDISAWRLTAWICVSSALTTANRRGIYHQLLGQGLWCPDGVSALGGVTIPPYLRTDNGRSAVFYQGERDVIARPILR